MSSDVGSARPGLLMMAALVLASCTSTTVVETTSTRSETTTTATTTTTVATNTTTPTTAGAFTGFETFPGTPPAELSSFETTMLVTMTLPDVTIEMDGYGVFVGDAYRCEISVSSGELTVAQSMVATPEMVWLDIGSGFQTFDPVSTQAQDALALCPANPGFWSDFTGITGPAGDPEVINGIPSRRVDATELLGAFGGLGLERSEGVAFDRAVMWFADQGGWVSAIDMVMILDSAAASEMLGVPVDPEAGTSQMSFVVHILNPDDPALTVALPG